MAKSLLPGAVLALALGGFAAPALAGPIQLSAFGQTSGGNTVVGVANGAQNQTTINVNSAGVSISQLFGQATPIAATFTLTATSTDAAATAFGLVIQHYAGSFCITSGPACAGINYLSGTFGDAAVGALGGPGLVVNVSNPPDTLVLTSSVIPNSALGSPNTFNLGFSNLNPALAICGTTICSFGASLAGTISAFESPVQTPEPASIAMLGMGLFGLGFFFRPKRVKN